MKKWIMVLVLVAIIATGTVFADHPSGLGIGIVGNWGWGGVWGGALSLKISQYTALLGYRGWSWREW